MGMNKTRHNLLKELFAEANSQGLDYKDAAGSFRSETVTSLCDGRRLSQCSERDIRKVIAWLKERGHTTGSGQAAMTLDGFFRKAYPATKTGMLAEIRDLGRIRFGENYIEHLNNLCARWGEKDGYHKLRVATLKKLKAWLIDHIKNDPWEIETV